MPTKIVIARDYRDGQQFINAQKDMADRLGLPTPAFEIIHNPEHARGRTLDLDQVIFTPRFSSDGLTPKKLVELAPVFAASWHAGRNKGGNNK